MARTKQTARKIFEVKCVQCGTQLERKLERYSALECKLVQSQRCSECQNCAFQCLDYKICLLDENLRALSKEDRGLTAVRFDFDGVYEINDSARKSVVKKFDRVHGKGSWEALGSLSPSFNSDDEDEEDDWLTIQRMKRVKRVSIANDLKRKWMLKTYTKAQNKKYKNAGARAWLSSQQASVASLRKC